MSDRVPTTGDLVRGALATAKINQRAGAHAIGVSQSQLSKRITGRLDFKVSELVTIARLCGVPVESLISPERVAA